MAETAAAPTVYWVVGDGTDVGKTTVAAALIAALNARGTRAVGFKPYAGGPLLGLVDFMVERYPGTPSRLFGNDGWELIGASPLTGPDLIDVVVPVQMITHPVWDKVVLMRTGAAVTGNLEYFCSADGARLKDRPDVKDIIARTGLPFAEAAVHETVGLRDGTGDAFAKQALAYDHLVGLGVDAVVCEGAGRWMPIWPGGPAVNHAVIVANGMITLIPGLDLEFAFEPGDVLRSIAELTGIFNASKRQWYALPQHLAEAARRAAVTRRTMDSLLEKTGLVGTLSG